MGVNIQELQPGDGQKFDSSWDRGKPFEFRLGQGQVIRAFDEAFPKMSVGERATLTCSPDVAYGPNGLPPRIPPNSTVIFEAHLLEVK